MTKSKKGNFSYDRTARSYPYEPEWYDPTLSKLNRQRWNAVNEVAEAWRTSDANHFTGILHKDFIYHSDLRPELTYSKAQFLREKKAQFKTLRNDDLLINDDPVCVDIVSIFRGASKLEYPYGVALSQMGHPDKASILLFRFSGAKIIEMLAANPFYYTYTEKIPTGFMRNGKGEPSTFRVHNGRFIPSGIRKELGEAYFCIHAALHLIRETGATVTTMSCSDDPSIANIETKNNRATFVYRIDIRTCDHVVGFRRVFAPLDGFAKQATCTQNGQKELAVLTLEPRRYHYNDGLPENGFNIFVNEAVHIIQPQQPIVHSTRQMANWLHANDSYLLNLSQQADSAWRENGSARPAPVALTLELLPIHIQKGLHSTCFEKYHALLSEAGHWLKAKAEAVKEKAPVIGLLFEANRLIRISTNRRRTM